MKKGLLVLLLAGFSVATSAEVDLKAGEEKANTICMACHGMNGISTNPEWPNLAGQGEKYLIKQLQDFKAGLRNSAVMAPQAMMLSDEDMLNVAAFYASQEAKQAATYGAGDDPDALLLEGEALYRGGDMANGVAACAACHGPTGAGIDPAAFPHLSGQHATYTRLQLGLFRQGAQIDELATDTKVTADQMRTNDPNKMMRDTTAGLTDKQIEAVALYIQGLH